MTLSLPFAISLFPSRGGEERLLIFDPIIGFGGYFAFEEPSGKTKRVLLREEVVQMTLFFNGPFSGKGKLVHL